MAKAVATPTESDTATESRRELQAGLEPAQEIVVGKELPKPPERETRRRQRTEIGARVERHHHGHDDGNQQETDDHDDHR